MLFASIFAVKEFVEFTEVLFKVSYAVGSGF